MRRTTLLVGVTVLALVTATSAGADQSYTDSRGDAGVGTDIVALTVRNDGAGNIQIQVQSVNPIVANHAIGILIDADRNQATGDHGDDYWMYGGPQVGIAFFAWNGSQFVEKTPASFQVGAAASNVTDFRINKADLGNVSGFNFAAVSISIDPPNINYWDSAPDHGYFSYDLAGGTTTTTASTQTVSVGGVTAKAPGLHAGKRFAISAPVTTNATSVRVTCTAKAGTATLHPRGSYAGRKATCSGTLPAGAAGKRLIGAITATVSGGKATSAFSFPIVR